MEIPILQGAQHTLELTNLLVIEAYNFTFGGPAVPFWELCQQMFQLGFRPLDVFDILYREVDHAFWQFDILFARADLPLFCRFALFYRQTALVFGVQQLSQDIYQMTSILPRTFREFGPKRSLSFIRFGTGYRDTSAGEVMQRPALRLFKAHKSGLSP